MSRVRPFSRRVRRLFRGFAALCLLWVLYFPARLDRLFRAMPTGMALGSYHRGLTREWRHLAEHPQLIPLLERAGVSRADRWSDDEGIFWTLFWLTGRHTVIGLHARPGDAVEDLRLCGASYVGWKARPLEFLWRIRWVPGLGRLDVTDAGTRYLTFRRSKSMRSLGLVLSLDIVEGVLVAVLSADPDAARELAARVRHDAPVDAIFRPQEEPWRNLPNAPHRLWVPARTTGWLDRRIGPWVLDVESLARPSLQIEGLGSPWIELPGPVSSWGFGPDARPAGPPAVEAAPFAAVMASQALVRGLWPSSWTAVDWDASRGVPWLTIDGSPYGGSLTGLAVPAANLRLPWRGDSPDTAAAWIDAVQGQALGPSWTARPAPAPSGSSRWLFGPAASGALLRLSDMESPFAEAGEGWVVLGSNLGSHVRQNAALAAEARPFTQAVVEAAADPDALAWVWIDCERVEAEMRHLAAVAQLAAMVSGGSVDRELAAMVLRGLHAAAALGQIEGSVRMNTGGLRATLRTVGSDAAAAD